jgi:hypothetical protein
MKHQYQHDQSKNNNGLVAMKQDLSTGCFVWKTAYLLHQYFQQSCTGVHYSPWKYQAAIRLDCLSTSRGAQRPLQSLLQEDAVKFSEDPGFPIFEDDDDDEKPPATETQSATATFAIFEDGDVNKEENIRDSSAVQPSVVARRPAFEIRIEGNEIGVHAQIDAAVDYRSTHDNDIKMSLRRLKAAASVASDSRASLVSLFSKEDKVYDQPCTLLPRALRG